VIVVGAGPAGLFAALQLRVGVEANSNERGKEVRRRRDLKAINVDHLVNEDSNTVLAEEVCTRWEIVYSIKREVM
jgi:flavin-dependent dehydrogenase